MYLFSGFRNTWWARKGQQKHQIFREYFNRYKRGEEFTPEQFRLFTRAISELRENVLNNADVIASTISCAGVAKLYSAVENPALILVDEAASVLEPDCWALWAF